MAAATGLLTSTCGTASAGRSARRRTGGAVVLAAEAPVGGGAAGKSCRIIVAPLVVHPRHPWLRPGGVSQCVGLAAGAAAARGLDHRGSDLRPAPDLERPGRAPAATAGTGPVALPAQRQHRAAAHARDHRSLGHRQELADEPACRPTSSASARGRCGSTPGITARKSICWRRCSRRCGVRARRAGGSDRGLAFRLRLLWLRSRTASASTCFYLLLFAVIAVDHRVMSHCRWLGMLPRQKTCSVRR